MLLEERENARTSIGDGFIAVVIDRVRTDERSQPEEPMNTLGDGDADVSVRQRVARQCPSGGAL